MTDLKSKGRQPEYAPSDPDVDMDAPEPRLEEQKRDPDEFSELDETTEIVIQLLREAAEKVLNEGSDQEDVNMEDAPSDSAEEHSETELCDEDDEGEGESEEDEDGEDDGEDEDDEDSDDDEEHEEEEETDDEPVVTEGMPPWGIRFTRNRPNANGQANKAPTPQYQRGRCDICGETVFPCYLSIMPCAHGYCPECLERLFKTSIADESLFPPRCCRQAVVIDTVRHILPKQLLASYYEKKREFESLNRIYCCKPNCSALIPSETIEDERGRCRKCGTEVCVICKFEAHDDDECPEDWELHEFLDFAADKGWGRCDRCGRVIERDFGCNHMV